MSQYRKKPIIVEATQWWKNGDHPEDDVTRGGTTPDGEEWEGLVVRYYRLPTVEENESKCELCGHFIRDHGFLDTPGEGHKVCPGDFVVTEGSDRHPIKPDIFNAIFEPALDSGEPQAKT